MLGSSPLIAFTTTAKPEAAKTFYKDTLGLELVADTSFAVVFDSSGVELRVQKVKDVILLPGTTLGWRVENLEDMMTDLGERGVSFERFPFLEQDSLGIWSSPDGARVAWFRDPDGNTLSLTEVPSGKLAR